MDIVCYERNQGFVLENFPTASLYGWEYYLSLKNNDLFIHFVVGFLQLIPGPIQPQ